MLAREQERHVDRDAGKDRLLDGGQSLPGPGDLDEEVAKLRPAEQRFGGGERARRIVCQQRRHFQRDPAIHAIGPVVNGAEKVGRPAEVVQRQLEEEGYGRDPVSDLRADRRVVGGAVLDRVIEDRRVRGETGHRQLVDVPLERPAIQQVAGDVVEPQTLAQLVKPLGCLHHVTVPGIGSPSPALRARWHRGEPGP